MTDRARRWGDLRALVDRLRLQDARRSRGLPAPPSEKGKMAAVLHAAMRGYAEHVGCPEDRLMADEWQTPSPYAFARWLLLLSGLVTPRQETEQLLGDLELDLSARAPRFPVREDALGVGDIPWWCAEIVHRRMAPAATLLQVAGAGGFLAADLERHFPAWRHADHLMERLLDLEDRLRHTPPPAGAVGGSTH